LKFQEEISENAAGVSNRSSNCLQVDS